VVADDVGLQAGLVEAGAQVPVRPVQNHNNSFKKKCKRQKVDNLSTSCRTEKRASRG
jgi:hypothetical protein